MEVVCLGKKVLWMICLKQSSFLRIVCFVLFVFFNVTFLMFEITFLRF